jgi:hypothetical protein
MPRRSNLKVNQQKKEDNKRRIKALVYKSYIQNTVDSDTK